MENEILQKYEQVFGDLPKLPKMGNYGTILSEMQDAIVRGEPLTIEEVMEIFKNSGFPLDQGD